MNTMIYKSKLDNEKQFSYLYSTKEKENLNLYFKLKSKNGYEFENQEEERIFEYKVLNFIKKYDLIIYPQTSGTRLPEYAKKMGKDVVMLEKNTKEDIKNLLLEQKMMKAEKTSLLNTIDAMEGDFQINKIKGNQRKRFIDILFKEIDLSEYKDKKVLVLDDSIFSGDTLKGMLQKVKIDYDLKVLFSKY